MKQRGRKSKASLSVFPGPRLVASSPVEQSPPPPDDLEDPEREIWRAIVDEFKGPRAAYLVLADAMRARARARQCAEVVEQEGLTVTGRDGQVKPHPLLAAERSATASFQRQLKALGIKF